MKPRSRGGGGGLGIGAETIYVHLQLKYFLLFPDRGLPTGGLPTIHWKSLAEYGKKLHVLPLSKLQFHGTAKQKVKIQYYKIIGYKLKG